RMDNPGFKSEKDDPDQPNGKLNKNGNTYTLSSLESESYEETSCGTVCFRPKWLQRFASPRMFLFAYCIQNVLSGAYNSYFVASTTSIERHFHFASKDIGLIVLLSEVGPVLFTTLVSYLGSRGNRPRWLAIGCAMDGTGVFIAFLSFLLFPAPKLSESGMLSNSKKYCSLEEVVTTLNYNSTSDLIGYSTTELPEDDGCFSSNKLVMAVWFIAYILKGIGSTSVYCIGAPYLDDNIPKRDAPVYFAISIAVRILGPLIGFNFASFVLRIYVNPNESYGIEPNDPRWVGAWWIGMLVFASTMLMHSQILGLFPRKMKNINRTPALSKKNSIVDDEIRDPSAASLEQSIQNFRRASVKEKISEKVNNDAKGLKQMAHSLFHNKALRYNIIGTFCSFMTIMGVVFWMPKYMEHTFRVSKSEAASWAGISATSSVILGVVGGGFWIRIGRPSARTVSIVMAVCSFLYSASLVGMTFITCDFNNDLPGTLSSDGKSLELYQDCSASCQCGTEEFIPVCVRDDISSKTYFSPCHAGCPDTGEHLKIFDNCTCAGDNANVTMGYCSESCSGFFYYNILTAVIKTMVSIGSIGGLLITIRCVSIEEKSVALGIKTTALSLVILMNPIVFGSLIDTSCLVWEEVCGEHGSCWVYDTQDFGYKLHGLGAILFFLSSICEALVGYYVGDLKLVDDTPTKVIDSKSDE
ncbi:unnamed protein product, partial [Meganyctiphanes norvegica]